MLHPGPQGLKTRTSAGFPIGFLLRECFSTPSSSGSAKVSRWEHCAFTGAGDHQEISARDGSKATHCSEAGDVCTCT